jgi:hypothetical protein
MLVSKKLLTLSEKRDLLEISDVNKKPMSNETTVEMAPQ